MDYKRILTIQDISCVGQCSLTVALPILSACGHETCILPTALLSTHTGGFGAPVVVHFGDRLGDIWRHWLKNAITFDAILVGYLGSIQAIDAALEIIDALLAPGGKAIVDPAMGDNGRLYAGFDGDYVRAMGKLCGRADILLPNVTEAALLTGLPYREKLEEGYVHSLLEGLPAPNVVLTGVGYCPGQTGIAVREGERFWHYSHPRVGGGCHGTGDIFAAAFTGALLRDNRLERAVRIAGNFTCRCVENTLRSPAHWYGVKFETALPGLMEMLQ